jgi:hypothetical protein
LGGYIRRSFPDWLRQFDGRREEGGSQEILPSTIPLDALIRAGGGTISDSQPGGVTADQLLEQIRDRLGRTHVGVRCVIGGYHVDLRDEACAAYILGEHCGLRIDPSVLDDVDCEENLREVSAWAVGHRAWGQDLLNAHDPAQCFLENLDDIIANYSEAE